MAGAGLRLGLIGAGHWGRAFIRTVGGIDGVVLTRLASRNPHSRDRVGAQCVIDTDWRAVVRARDLDGVIIATPPDSHAEVTHAAISAGLPVLVEKPVTLDRAQAAALLEAAEAARAIVLVDHIHLFSPAYRELKSRVADAGGAEVVRAINSQAGGPGPYRHHTPALWDWGPHDAAMCLDLMGDDPAQVTARRTEHRELDGGVGETLEIAFRFARGVAAELSISNLFTEKRRRFEVACADAVYLYDDRASHKLTRRAGAGGAPEPVAIAPDLPLGTVVETFAAMIRSGTPDSKSLRLGVRVVDLLAHCEEALQK